MVTIMKWVLSNFKVGSIVRTKVNESFFHYGIILDNEKVIQYGTGKDAVEKKAKDVEVLITSLDEFNCSFVEVAKLNIKEKIKRNSVKKTLEIANSRLGEKKYDFLKNNCEHFVFDCVFNKHYSSQISQMRENVKKKHKLFFKK